MQPAASGVSSSLAPQAVIAAAWAKFHEGDRASAAALAASVRHIQPMAADAEYICAVHAFRTADFRSALIGSMRVTILNPGDRRSLDILGSALQVVGAKPFARTVYGRSLAVLPTSETMLVSLGIMDREFNRPQSARRSFRRCLAVNPQSLQALSEFAHTELTLCQLSPRMPTAAFKTWLWRTLTIFGSNPTLAYRFFAEGSEFLTWQEYDRAVDLYCRSATEPLPAAGGRVINTDDPALHFGETAFQFGLFLKAQRLGIVRPLRLVSPLVHETANRYLVELIGKHVDMPSREQYLANRADYDALPRYSTEFLRWRDGRFYTKEIAVSLVEREWESEPRPPLLQMDAASEDRGWQWMRRRGLPEGGWFATVHCRDGGYDRQKHSQAHTDAQDFRNADIRSFLPAIDHILELGGCVVRLGAPHVPDLPARDGLIDYAKSDDRSDMLDVFFCAKARLFIGTASGPQAVAPLFGVPLASTNWCVLARPPWSRGDVFVPKLMWSDRERRHLSLAEMVTPPLRYFDNRTLARRKLRLIANTPDEILECVKQRWRELESGPTANPETDALHDAVRRAVAAVGNPLNSRMADYFLIKHRDVLFPRPTAAP
jgi:putative glycosyltransferase (TIGR04372 family)